MPFLCLFQFLVLVVVYLEIYVRHMKYYPTDILNFV
jgi:hypothetical protein